MFRRIALALSSSMPISATFPISGRSAIAYPARANFGGTTTAAVIQAQTHDSPCP